MANFLSVRAYRRGALGAGLALSYLGLVALFLVPAAAEAAPPGPADGSFFFGLGMLATMPLSIAVMLAYSAIATSQGIPLSDQDGSWWVIPAFALCALVNAALIWVIFRGRRIRPLIEAPPAPPLK
ncbi:MAG TPA: hypothetical protein VFN34_03665 [Ornithinibacter sp.]|nr:hypothetical protein [Ornithinibacter sp.]